MIAAALGGHSWDVWWDREIPLGKAFDEVIEKAIAQARCVIVLWSAASVASEWVRNEAAEGKRRGILVPVFIEQIDAPLAFRSLNGADLSAWSGHGGDAEFVRLVERVSELLGQAGNESFAGGAQPSRVQQAPTYKETQTKWALKPWVVVSLANCSRRRRDRRISVKRRPTRAATKRTNNRSDKERTGSRHQRYGQAHP